MLEKALASCPALVKSARLGSVRNMNLRSSQIRSRDQRYCQVRTSSALSITRWALSKGIGIGWHGDPAARPIAADRTQPHDHVIEALALDDG